MSQESFPANNVDFDSSQWRALLARFGDGILDAKTDVTKGFPLPNPLPSSGNTLTLGPGLACVQGFGLRVPDSQAVTIPASVGGTQVSTVVIRYDPTRTVPNPDYDSGDPESPATLGVPCALQVLTGTAGGSAPTLTQNPGGVWDFPLYNITRAVGQSLAAAGRLDRRIWVTGSGSAGAVIAGVGASGTPTAPLQTIAEKRTMRVDTQGRVTLTFPGSGFPTGFHAMGSVTVEMTAGGFGELVPATATKTQVTLRLRTPGGAPYNNVDVTFHYAAVGF